MVADDLKAAAERHRGHGREFVLNNDRVAWPSTVYAVELNDADPTVQGTPEGARSRLGARPRGSRTPFASTAKESAVRPAPAAAFGKSCVRMSSTPHESTGLYVECSARCGAATMFSKPRVSTVVRHRNSRPRRSNAPTSAVLDASSRLCRVPNSAMPKYATPSKVYRYCCCFHLYFIHCEIMHHTGSYS